MILSLVSMTRMSSFSGSLCLTFPSGAAASGVMGRNPPPLSTTWVISSPTPWIDLITLLPSERKQGGVRVVQRDCSNRARTGHILQRGTVST